MSNAGDWGFVGGTPSIRIDGPTLQPGHSALEGMEEAEKYRKMWEHPEYRQIAPGEQVAQVFLAQARPKPGSEIIDFGAGTGRGAFMLALFGQMKVRMLDFAENCLDDDMRKGLETQAQSLSFAKQDLNDPIPWVAEYGFCFPAGTPVNGSGKTIDAIAVGDMVTNRNGRPQAVLKTFQRKYTGHLYGLGIDCLSRVEMTDEHPILVTRQIKRVHRQNTYGGKPSVYEMVPDEPQWVSAKEVLPGDWIEIPQVSTISQPRIVYQGRERQIDIAIDEGLAWLIGLYVAEGHVGHSPEGRITFSLGAHEDLLAQRALQEFKRLDINARISQPPSIAAMNGLHVIADAIDFGRLLEQWCGKGAHGKRIPQQLINADETLLRAFLSGLVDGDGCVRKDSRNGSQSVSITTVSRILAQDVLTALVKIGVYCAWSTATNRRGVIGGRSIAGAESHTVSWSLRAWLKEVSSDGRVSYGRMRFINGRAFARIAEVTKRWVSDLPVFNIHTEDETYGVPFTVHNCTDVMEHIPPKQVDTVLHNVLKASQHCFFQISCVDDVCGKLIGEPLHLSVHPYDWWLKKFRDEFECVIHWSEDRGDCCLFYVSAWWDSQKITDAGILNVEEEEAKANVRINAKPEVQQCRPHEANEVEVLLLGGGPSLNAHEADIRRLLSEGCKIVTLNGAYNWAVDKGLQVGATIVCDARDFNLRFVQPTQEKCKYLLASQCHPSLYAACPPEQTYQWHTTAEMIRDILNEQLPEWYGVPGGSTVLLRAIPLLRMLGFKRFHLFGCDSCIMDEKHHAYAQPENDGVMVMDTIIGGRIFKCHAWHSSQANEFIQLIKVFGEEIELEIYGNGLLAWIMQCGANMDLEREAAEASAENAERAVKYGIE